MAKKALFHCYANTMDEANQSVYDLEQMIAAGNVPKGYTKTLVLRRETEEFLGYEVYLIQENWDGKL